MTIANRWLLCTIRQAQSALADKLLGPGQLEAAGLQPELQQITRLRTELLELSARTKVDIRNVLIPSQIAAAGQVRARLTMLRAEMRQLLEPRRVQSVSEWDPPGKGAGGSIDQGDAGISPAASASILEAVRDAS